jgi:DNA-binding transcriptional LysR family regulator
LLQRVGRDDPIHLLSRRRGGHAGRAARRPWIAGCERCRSHLLALCAAEGYEPRIGYTPDDMVVMQALVAAGLGVTTIPGLALRAHRAEGIVASELPDQPRRVYAATYGEPPDPPATVAVLAALAQAAAA